ncbi:MAG TPA: polynucleotide adenylyltransferase PcnB [Spirochaetota bacterium]|nr:polynucleotide adenylyltransferase PcnB [Spirochaetota bacterium]HPJ35910.1 polynucleotide adenylyltransferase PcnB [Spirochaetota bacterium]
MKFIPSLFKVKTGRKYPVIVPSGTHPMQRRLVERGVLDILFRLKRNGYESYLVGGCVRDILLGMTPKDFDIVTDAHPRQIKRLFSRCYLIGKRFRLAHVYISADRFIEVATFRAASVPVVSKGKTIQNNNVFGTIEEDVMRRDFTINALYYNSADSSIVDYTGGLADINKKIIRSIGDPAERFVEDPVRMIRAARFSARFGFRLSKKDYRAAVEGAGLILNANANRLLEELYKILRCGASSGSIVMLHRLGVLKYWLPELDENGVSHELRERLAEVDRRKLAGEEITTGVLITVLFYDLFTDLTADSGERTGSHEFFLKAREVFTSVATRLHLPRKESDRVCNIISRRLYFSDMAEGKKNSSFENRFVRNEHFNDTLDFYSILSEVTEGYSGKVGYWKKAAEKYREEAGRENQPGKAGRGKTPGKTSRNPKPAPDRKKSSGGSEKGPAAGKKTGSRKYRGRAGKKSTGEPSGTSQKE